MPDESAPPAALVKQLKEALLVFLFELSNGRSHCELAGYLVDLPWEYSVRRLGVFAEVADALCPLRRYLDGTAHGWPFWLGETIRSIAETFDAVTAQWGWNLLARPEPERSAHVASLRSAFVERYDRPRYEGALSWRAGNPRPEGNPLIELDAREAWRDYRPTMTPEDGLIAHREAVKSLGDATPLGKAPIVLLPDDRALLNAAYHELRNILQSMPATEQAAAHDGNSSERPNRTKTLDDVLADSPRESIDQKATAALALHPDWSNKQIADKIGCHPRSLSNLPKHSWFKRSRQTLKAEREHFRRER